MRSLVLLAISAACYLSVSATMQNVTVKGIAVCNKKRMGNVHVELYDKDTLNPNDLLAETHTNSDGEFELYGQEDEVGTIEPFIRLHHPCKAKPGCQRVGDYIVPADKIGGVYDMTYVTLDIAVPDESEKC
ncbi:Transthyretin-like family protein [Cooperia oncophora]